MKFGEIKPPIGKNINPLSDERGFFLCVFALIEHGGSSGMVF
jgi:hypothetical protein